MTKRLILALLLSCSPLWATTYYVDNCVTVGNDRNNGTSTSTPWLTINKVNTSKFNPGDSILFESTCTWREQLTVPSSGSAGSPITFGTYGTGAQPIISGANLFTNWTLSSGSIYYASYSTAPNQVFEDSGRLTENTVSTASLTAGQWYLDTVNRRIWVYLTAGDNPSGHTMEASQRQYAIDGPCDTSYVTVSGITADKASYRGIYFCPGSGKGVFITGATALRNFEEGIRVDGGVGSTVTQSTAAYNGWYGFTGSSVGNLLFDHLIAHDNAQLRLSSGSYSGGIALASGSGTGSQTVQYCLCYNNGVPGSAGGGHGIYADTVDNGLLIQYNLVYGNTLDGIGIDADQMATVMYNVVYNNGSYGIVVFADALTSMTGNLVYNNTVVGNTGMGIEMIGQSSGSRSGPSSCTNNAVINNIVVNTTSGPNLGTFLGCENPGTNGVTYDDYPANGSGNVYTYNDFGAQASNFIQWGGTFSRPVYESTYSAWETAAGNCGTVGCSHSVQSAFTFANASAGQFWLTSGSPGIDAGLNLGSPYNIGLMPGSTWPNSVTTGNQNTYGSGWEIGAFIYVPVAPDPLSNLQAVAH